MNDKRNDTHGKSPFRFMPIPVATGRVWTKEDGSTVEVDVVEVQVRTSEGHLESVRMRWVCGGWWSPATP